MVLKSRCSSNCAIRMEKQRVIADLPQKRFDRTRGEFDKSNCAGRRSGGMGAESSGEANRKPYSRHTLCYHHKKYLRARTSV
jgi:hypothetical protein